MVAVPVSVVSRAVSGSAVPMLNVSPVDSAPVAALDEIARCLSPGPACDGPPPEHDAVSGPLSLCPDWPISDSWLNFAFDTVVLDAHPEDDFFSSCPSDNNFQ